MRSSAPLARVLSTANTLSCSCSQWLTWLQFAEPTLQLCCTSFVIRGLGS